MAVIFGRHGESCDATDTRAFAFNGSCGTAKKGGPAQVGRIVAKLVDGRAASLTAHERSELALLGIAIAPAPRSDPQKLGNELLAQGLSPAVAQQRVNEEAAKADTFVSVEPIRSLTFYRPAVY